MEAIDRDGVRRDVVHHAVVGPVGQRVDLHEIPVRRVDLDLARIRAIRVLIPAQPGDVGVEVREVPAHGQDLPDPTATLSVLVGRVEEIHSRLADHLLDLVGVREDDFNWQRSW